MERRLNVDERRSIKSMAKVIVKVISLVIGFLLTFFAYRRKDEMDTKTYLGDLIMGYFWLLIALLYD